MKKRGLLPSKRKVRRPAFGAWCRLLGSVESFRREAMRAQRDAALANRGKENLGELHGKLMREGKWCRRVWSKVKEAFGCRKSG